MAGAAGDLIRPSSWLVRRERQRVAHAIVAEKMTNITDKIDKLMTLVESMNTTLRIPPPGLHPTEYEIMHERLQRLETLVVCSPSLTPTVDEVLDQMLGKRHVHDSKKFNPLKSDTKDVMILPSVPPFPFDDMAQKATEFWDISTDERKAAATQLT